jgi:hypothetical protein
MNFDLFQDQSNPASTNGANVNDTADSSSMAVDGSATASNLLTPASSTTTSRRKKKPTPAASADGGGTVRSLIKRRERKLQRQALLDKLRVEMRFQNYVDPIQINVG